MGSGRQASGPNGSLIVRDMTHSTRITIASSHPRTEEPQCGSALADTA